MSKFLSGRQSKLYVGISSMSDEKTVLQVTGKVGIGTTTGQHHSLYVTGSANISDEILVGGGATVVGIASFQSDVFIDNNLTVQGITIESGGSTDLDQLNVSGLSTFGNTVDINADLDVDGHTELDNLNVSGVSTFASDLDVNANVSVSGVVTATTFVGDLTGVATTATQLETARNFSVTGDFVTAPAVSFDGTGAVALAATITADSITLGTYTSGDYVQTVTGTSNQITVTGGTGESSTPVLSFPNQVTLPQDLTVTRDVQIIRNLNVDGNITVGGTSATIFTETLRVADADLVLGIRTDANGNDVSTDNTASHGGIAIASTEGSPLVTLVNPGAGETLPSTYKKMMWFKEGSFSGLGTDAWLINYAVGIGSTQFPTGTRLAAGSVQFTENDISVVRDINASGIITANSATFSGLSNNHVVIVGSNGELENDGNFTYDGAQLNVGTGITVGETLFTKQLSVAGVSTFEGDVHIGYSPFGNELYFHASNSTFASQIRHVGSSSQFFQVSTSAELELKADKDVVIKDNTWSTTRAIFKDNGAVELYYPGPVTTPGIPGAGVKRFETTSDGVGITSNLTLTSDDDGSTAGPELKLYRDSDSAADADYLGQIKFAGESDTGVERNYAKITGKILDASNGTEDGIIEFAHIKAGSQTITGRFRSDSLQLLNGTSLTVAGDSTFTGSVDANAGADIFGLTELDDVNVSSAATIASLDVNKISPDGVDFGGAQFILRATGSGTWEWADIPGIFSVNNILNGFNVSKDSSIVGTAGSITQLDFRSDNLIVSADPQPNGIATIRLTSTPSFDSLSVSGITTLAGITTQTSTLFTKQLEVAGVSTFHENARFVNDKYLGFGDPGSFGNGEFRIRKRANDQATIQNENGDFVIDNQVDSYSNYISLQGRTTRIEGRYGGQVIAQFIDGGASELNYDGTKKFETTGAGVTVFGTTETQQLNVTGVSTYAGDADFNGHVDIDGHTELDNVNISGIATFANNIDANGDLDVDGHTNLDNVSVAGVSTFSDDVNIIDGKKIQLGNSADLQLYHNGTSSYIDNNTSHVYIRNNVDNDDGGNIYIQAKSGENSIVCNDDGNVELYYNNVNTFQTNANGVKVQGPSGGSAILYLNADQGSDDIDKFRFKVEDGGPLSIENDASGSWEKSIEITGNGAVSLYHDNVSRLQTTNTGINVVGHTELDNVSVSGVSTFTGAIDANGDLDVDGRTELDTTNISETLNVVGITTLASSGGITTTGGDLYVNDDIYFRGDLYQDNRLFTSGVGIGSTATNPESGEITSIARVGSGFTDINFVGTGLSITGYGSTIVVDFGNIAAGSGGATVTVSESSPGAGSTTTGDLWWDSTAGDLKIYYVDDDSAAWIDANGGSQALAIVSENSPTGYGITSSGTLWWDSTTGVLKVYYTDADSNQWVDANSGAYINYWLPTVFGDGTSGIHTLGPVGVGTTAKSDYDLYVEGNINFNGSLFQDESPFVASRWTAGEGDDIHRIDGQVGVGTTNPRYQLEVGAVGASGTSLLVNGDARVTGILSVGQGTITLDPDSNMIKLGALSMHRDSGGDALLMHTTGGYAPFRASTFLIDTVPVIDNNRNVNAGIGTVTLLDATDANVSGACTFASTVEINSNRLQIKKLKELWISNDVGTVDYTGVLDVTGNSLNVSGNDELRLRANSDVIINDATWNYTRASFSDTSVDLYYGTGSSAPTKVFETTSYGVGIAGTLTVSKNLEVTGNVSIAGTLTYEDVTNIDSIGIVTARSGIEIGTGTSISSPSNNVLTLGTNDEERLRLTSDGKIGFNDCVYHGTTESTLTTTSATAIHHDLSTSEYRTVEYVVSVTEGTTYHATKIIALQDGSDAYYTEYGTIFSNTTGITTFDVDVDSGKLRLLAFPASTNSTNYKVSFTAFKA